MSNRVVLVVLFLALGGFGAQTAAGEPIIFRRGTGAEPVSLDPHHAWGGTGSIIAFDLFVGLLTAAPNGDIVPGLAQSYTVSDDGLVYTFKLRPGVVWSDGKPITSEDVVYSFHRALDPKTASRMASLIYPIKNGRGVNTGTMAPETLGVRAVDDATVEITLESPKIYFPKLLLGNICSLVPRHVIEEFGSAWTKPENMVTDGAYTLAESVPKTYVRVVKNPLFYDATNVQIDEVYYYPTEDLATSFRQYRAGELDVALNFPPNQIEWIKANLPGQLHTAPALGLYYYIVNIKRPPFDNANVRKALAIAIDRELLTEKILGTGVVPAYGVVPPGVTNYAAPMPAYASMTMDERKAEARRLLAQAGYGPENPLHFKFQYNTLEENRIIAVASASMWSEIGVQAEPENIEFLASVTLARSGDFDMLRYTWYAPMDDAMGFLGLVQTGNTSNRSNYANANFDALISQSDNITDEVQRAAVLKQAEELAMSDFPVIPIYYYAQRNLVSPRIKGWSEDVKGANFARNLRIEN